jgi:hypothetical protein
MEVPQELGRSYDFLVEYRWEPGEQFQSFLCTRKRCEEQFVQQRGIAKRRKTKCGETNRRKSECLNSTGEIGELSNPEESKEGSEASEF